MHGSRKNLAPGTDRNGGVIMTNTATMTYSGHRTGNVSGRRSLWQKFRTYWEENSPEIMAAMGTISGNPVSFREYLMLKKAVNA